MNDADRTLLSRLADGLLGRQDPAREAIERAVVEHGRDNVAKALGDLGLAKAEPVAAVSTTTPGSEGEPTDAELRQLFAELTGEATEATTSTDPALETRLGKIEAALDKLAKAAGAETSTETKASTDELELAKAGVPFEAIQAARPMLQSSDATVAQAAADLLMKQAPSSTSSVLLGKEAGSAAVPPAPEQDNAQVSSLVDRLAKADGDTGSTDTSFEAELARRLAG